MLNVAQWSFLDMRWIDIDVHYVKKGEKPKKKNEDDEWIYIQWFAEEFPEIRKEDWYKEKKEYFEKVSDATCREDWRHPDPELKDLWCNVVQNDSSDTR